MQSNKGNALISIIVIIIVLSVGALYSWKAQSKKAAEIRKQQEVSGGFDYSFLNDDAGEYSVIEADADVRSFNDQIDQTTFDESLY